MLREQWDTLRKNNVRLNFHGLRFAENSLYSMFMSKLQDKLKDDITFICDMVPTPSIAFIAGMSIPLPGICANAMMSILKDIGIMFNKAVSTLLLKTLKNPKYSKFLPDGAAELGEMFMYVINKPVKDVLNRIDKGLSKAVAGVQEKGPKVDIVLFFQTIIGLIQSTEADINAKHVADLQGLAENTCRDSVGEFYPDKTHREIATKDETMKGERLTKRMLRRLKKIANVRREAESMLAEENKLTEQKAAGDAEEGLEAKFANVLAQADRIVYGTALLFHPDLCIDQVLKMIEPAIKAIMMTA